MSTETLARVFHDTIVMERTYRASPARVFAAWKSVEARQRWSGPSPDVDFVYEQHDFRVGGLDIARCGAPGDLRYCAEVRYMEITPDARIVFSERVTEADIPRAAALIDVSMEAQRRRDADGADHARCSVRHARDAAGLSRWLDAVARQSRERILRTRHGSTSP